MSKHSPYLKYLKIPNILTGTSLLTGFVVLLLMLQQEIKLAFSLYTLTVFFDRIDGIVARKLKLESDFGKEFDSLADFFNFCILPALMAYLLGYNSILPVLSLMVYIIAGAGRLVHFNLTGMEKVDGKQYFSGVPTAVAACWFVIIFSLCRTQPGINFYYWMPAFFIIAAILMVSSLKYNKNGFITKLLYPLMPLAIVILWMV